MAKDAVENFVPIELPLSSKSTLQLVEKKIKHTLATYINAKNAILREKLFRLYSLVIFAHLPNVTFNG